MSCVHGCAWVHNWHALVTQIANCMWAVVKLGLQPPQAWVGRCLVACRHHLAACTPQQLANICYALALAPHWLDNSGGLRTRWLEALFWHVQAQLPSMKPQELSNTLWAAARIHAARPLPSNNTVASCLAAAGQLASQHAEHLNSQELCNVLWALGRLCGQPGLHGHSLEQGTPRQGAPRQRPGSTGGTAGSSGQAAQVAVIPMPPPTQLRPLLQQAWARAAQLRPSGLASLLLAMGWLGVQPQHRHLHGCVNVKGPKNAICPPRTSHSMTSV